jgi:hypothetical protein
MTATVDILGLLHQEVAEALREKIRDGSATAADISAAIKFLKDNGIEARVDKNPALKSLAETFPVFSDDDEYGAVN